MEKGLLNTFDKELLLKDLCARLPYGVKIELTWWVMGEGTCINTTLEPDNVDQLLNDKDGDIEIKPYLFPLSSITKEQLFEVQEILGKNEIEIEDGFLHIIDSNRNTISYSEITALLEWFYKNHFDINNLISMKLAIDATGLNIY